MSPLHAQKMDLNLHNSKKKVFLQLLTCAMWHMEHFSNGLK